jgi:hypothetical protein
MSTKSRISVEVDESVAVSVTKNAIADRIDELVSTAEAVSKVEMKRVGFAKAQILIDAAVLIDLAEKIRSEPVIVPKASPDAPPIGKAGSISHPKEKDDASSVLEALSALMDEIALLRKQNSELLGRRKAV